MLNPRRIRMPLAGVLALGVVGSTALAQVNVTTQHNDNARTGANLAETQLTTSNVTVSSFGKLFARAVDDQIYAQPLVVTGVNIPNVGVRNVVYVATVNDSVYAFDADDPNASAPYWVVHYADPANGIVPVRNTDVGNACGTYRDFSGNIGIVGSPVIDVASQTIYFVARTKENGVFVQRFHALDIRNGSERTGSPVVIHASVTGTGAGSQNGVISFNPKSHNQRPALALGNGNVYIGWASHCDTFPYHGWLIAYDAATLAQTAVFNTTPNGGKAGIWQSGQAPSFDDAGNLYASTGNGTFTGDTNGRDFGETVMKLSPTLTLMDWFTPFNVDILNGGDTDLGSAGVLLVPETNLAVTGGKEGKFYVLNRSNLGHHQTASDSQIVQSFQVSMPNHHIHGSPVYFKNAAGEQFFYIWPEAETGKMYKYVNGMFTPTPVQQTTVIAPDGMPGAMLSISSNGSAPGTAILWANHQSSGNANQEVRPGILRAFDATDLTHELWNSGMNAPRDDFGNFAKFSYPTVANGKVYLATFSNQLMVYGLLGRGSDTPGAYIPGSGAWFLRNANAGGAADVTVVYGPGGAGLVPISGDWDGNGTTTLGLYDPATGAFFLRNANTPGGADATFTFGPAGGGLRPVAGDWDGNGSDSIGLYNPATGAFFLRNALGSGPADVTLNFGPSSGALVPLAGDWDGNGTDTIGLYDPATASIFLRNTNTPGPADLTFVYGPSGATPVIGDWNNDRIDTVSAVVPATGAWFLHNTNASGPADLTFVYGPSGATPIAGDWDGQ